MNKKLQNIAIIQNYLISDDVKEKLTISEIHKTPLYLDEYQYLFFQIEAEILEKEALKKELWLNNHSNNMQSKSRNLIKKFKY